ncbi:vesicle transport through interaction with t-SNAREs homolog 1A [Nilaparvata lugens]|uniref:vesicle transport through interaction with t-SNAREs homolog 1A n=1 Tax=Nilaparvata lugens TaxID=108931 RepID=UPI000B982FE9|nr:vesicle transport through interaction with t-SNAREs homolog 1A [Nilaparvata lugens]
MAALIDVYEQQYAVITADITSKIGRLSNLSGGERRHVISELDKLFDEAKELMEQMGLEVHELKSSDQSKLKTRIESYKAELKRLEQEFSNAKKSSVNSQDGYSERIELYSECVSLNEEQKQRLLDNAETVERTGKKLTAGYQVLLETEDIGNQVLRDLHSQRETIQKSRSRLRETNAELGRSNRIINAMINRSLQHRFLLTAIAISFCLVVMISIYISATRSR